jgi:hypothetical protein
MPAYYASILPSHGLFYKDAQGSSLLPEGKVMIRKMTLEEEEMVQSPGLDGLTRIGMIARNSCILADQPDQGKARMKFDDLLFTDQQAILLRQRLITHGPNYTFKFVCVGCQQATSNDHNVEKEWNEITPDVCMAKAIEEGKDGYSNDEPFAVHLADQDIDIEMRFLRVKDQAPVMRLVKQYKAASKDARDPSYRISLARSITKWGGMIKPEMEVIELLRNITSSDLRIIRKERSFREPRIDTTITTKCKNCGTDNTVQINMDNEFFLPT